MISIPLMVIALAVALGPLLYQHIREGVSAENAERRHVEGTLADLDNVPVSPATRARIQQAMTASPAA